MGNCQLTSDSSHQIGLYEYKSNHIIGTNDNGTLYMGYPMNNTKFSVAIKCLNRPFSGREYNEIRPLLVKLVSMEGEHILKYIDYYHDDDNSKLYLISEYRPYGNLNDLIMSELKLDPLEDLRTAIIYCQQIIKGLITLHRNHIIHGRLTPKNVLIDGRNLKINDFGLYKLVSRERKTKGNHSVYQAPELSQGLEEPTERCDIWSLGVIMYHLIYKLNPIKVIGGEYVFYNLMWGKCETFDDLAKKCLVIEPENRISSEELEKHPFLQLSPEKIDRIPIRWASMKTIEIPSPHTAVKMFHEMEMGFNTTQ